MVMATVAGIFVVSVSLLAAQSQGRSWPQLAETMAAADALSLYEMPVLEKRAESGDAEAQVLLGLFYLGGRTLPANESEAIKWISKAAENGYAPGQFWFAALCQAGRGLTTDLSKAAQWYRKAADQNYPAAQHNLLFCMLLRVASVKITPKHQSGIARLQSWG